MSNSPLVADYVRLARSANYLAIYHQRLAHLFAAGDWRVQRDGYMQAARLARQDARR